MTQIEFADLGLPEPLLRAVSERNFVHPTPIQAQSIPPLLQGRDLLGIAQTGSGKTAAFVLPILARIGADRSRPAAFMARALILAPTRELAQQIEETVRQLSAGLRLNVVLIVGGASRFRQASAMRRGADVVVGTPGRVMDLMGSRELDLSLVGDFVLDEADRMLDMGFLPDVRRIVDTLPSRRRSAMFLSLIHI